METQTTQTENENSFSVALTKFIDGWQKKIDEDRAVRFPNLEREILVTEYGSQYVRIWRRRESETNRGSAVAFVALADNQTKGMGTVKCGDIFKSASWKAPARHARGNIFAPDGGLTHAGPYGMAYLR